MPDIHITHQENPMQSLSALTLAIGSWILVPGGTWEPAENEIADAREKLKPYAMAQAEKRKDDKPRPWETYTFQYQGSELDGKKVIYINAFCDKPPDYAAKQMVIVLDGGHCYFQAWYDTATKSFIRLFFNGVA
jgi:hypothetical protein